MLKQSKSKIVDEIQLEQDTFQENVRINPYTDTDLLISCSS